MTLPDAIPEGIRALAQPAAGLPEGEVGWSRRAALRLLDTIRGTKIAVCEGRLYKKAGAVFAPTTTIWSCEPHGGELATDFARRSQELARSHVDDLPATRHLLVLDLWDQSDAAGGEGAGTG